MIPCLGRAVRPALVSLLTLTALAPLVRAQTNQDRAPEHPWKQHDIRRPRPQPVAPAESIASKPPADALILFDGSNLDAWRGTKEGPVPWHIIDGALVSEPGAGQIETKQSFGDIQLHVEWAAPSEPHGVGQDRGNSGVFLMNQFEIQVLDSYQAETYADGQAGAIYGQFPPLFNASRPPGEWQCYDIAFRRPRFNSAGVLLEPAGITVFHNGILIQNNETPFGPTSWLKWLPYDGIGETGPIALQDHDHPVRYRNIWLRELPDRARPSAEHLAPPPIVSLSAELLDRYAGRYLLETRTDAAVVARDGDHLTVTFPFRPGALEMLPVSETEFVLSSTDGRFTFQVDEQGRVTGVHFRIGDGERAMRRLDR